MTREQVAIRKRAKDTARAVKANKGMKKKDREAEAEKILKGAEKDINTLEMKRTGNGIPEDVTCVICERRITTGDYRVLGFRDGQMICRHEGCAPGTARWMRSKIGQASKNRKYFKEEGEGKEVMEANDE